MGVWGDGRKKPSHTPILPHTHTKLKPEGKARLYGLMHGSVESPDFNDVCIKP